MFVSEETINRRRLLNILRYSILRQAILLVFLRGYCSIRNQLIRARLRRVTLLHVCQNNGRLFAALKRWCVGLLNLNKIFSGILIPFCLATFLFACDKDAWNNPYPLSEQQANYLYSSFSERPNHLDPARSYSSNEIEFTGQIYEPPLEYHYLKRPYELQPLTATEMPVAKYFDENDQALADDTAVEDIAYSVYEIKIKQGVRYQPHPAFAKTTDDQYRYHKLSKADIDKVNKLSDFKYTGTRELIAADYVYQIKRLAHPKLHSPILGLMSDYIVGLGEYSKTLGTAYDKLAETHGETVYLDLNQYPLAGAEVVDKYTYRIKVTGKYPQLLYWLAMPFFAPIPYEADLFYTQAGMQKKNITLDWYPVGTGPYMLTVNNPNREMVLERNPNFHGQTYPQTGDRGDVEAGLLVDAGAALPFIEKAVYKLEKEDIPYWNKFLQGYYDTSGISSDSFDQAVQVGSGGEAQLTDEMLDKDIRLVTSVGTSTYYIGFNMLDPVVGGESERARKLRQAISIAVDYEEYISIFLNGRGISAQGPIPPGIFGYREGAEGINPYVYDWVNGKPKRKSIEVAKQLLNEAGYQDSIDPKTGQLLILYFDSPLSSGPGSKAYLDWMRKQFKKLDIQLVFRNTDYNRFQEKMLKGSAQIFRWGWNADYPDPENFLFLLYGPNGKADYKGENASNYQSRAFDVLFEKMKNMDSGPDRQKIIDEMVNVVRRDMPWIWGYHPKQFGLYHDWYRNAKPNLMANNTLKYKRVDEMARQQKREQWNKPLIWPVILLIVVFIAGTIPAVSTFRKKEKMAAR